MKHPRNVTGIESSKRAFKLCPTPLMKSASMSQDRVSESSGSPTVLIWNGTETSMPWEMDPICSMKKN